MRSRHLFKIVLIVLTGLALFSQVYAKTETAGIVEVKPKVVSGFNSTVSVNYLDTKGYNILIKLDKTTNYKFKGKVPVGKYKLDSIETVKGYKAEINKTFEVKEGKVTTLNISIDKLIAKSTDNHIKNLPKTTSGIKSTDKSKTSDITRTPTKTTSKPSLKTTNNTIKNEGFTIGNSGIFTIIVFLILAICLFVLWLKNKPF